METSSETDFLRTVNQLQEEIQDFIRKGNEEEIRRSLWRCIELAEGQTNVRSALLHVNQLVSQCPVISSTAEIVDQLGCALLKATAISSAVVNFHTAIETSEQDTDERKLRYFLHLCDAYARVERHRQVVRYGTQAVNMISQSEDFPYSACMRDDLLHLYDLLTKSEQALKRFKRAKYWLKQSLRWLSADKSPQSTPCSPMHRSNTCLTPIIQTSNAQLEEGFIRYQCWRKMDNEEFVKICISECAGDIWLISISDMKGTLVKNRIVTKSHPWRKLQPNTIARLLTLDEAGKIVLKPLLQLPSVDSLDKSPIERRKSEGKQSDDERKFVKSGERKGTTPPTFTTLSNAQLIKEGLKLKVPRYARDNMTYAVSCRHCPTASSSPTKSPDLVNERVVRATTRKATNRITIRISEDKGEQEKNT